MKNTKKTSSDKKFDFCFYSVLIVIAIVVISSIWHIATLGAHYNAYNDGREAIIVSDINLRSHPTQNYDPVGIIDSGEKVILTGITVKRSFIASFLGSYDRFDYCSNWTQVEYQGKTYYISSKAVK